MTPAEIAKIPSMEDRGVAALIYFEDHAFPKQKELIRFIRLGWEAKKMRIRKLENELENKHDT